MSQLSGGTEGLLLRAWSLASKRSPQAQNLRTSSVEVLGRTVLASLSIHGCRGVIVPLLSAERPHIGNDMRHGSLGAIRAERSQFRNGEGVVDALHVWCVDHHCDDAFTSFAASWVDRIVRADSGEIGAELETCYKEFVRLVGSAQSSASLVTGLIGELMVLRDLVLIDAAALDFWGGPQGERHDFRHSATALEVKTSRRSEEKTGRIHVSDWDQLEIPDRGRLFLHSIRLEKVFGGAVSVASIISDIHSRLDTQGVSKLAQLLRGFGREVLESTEEFSEQSRVTFEVTSDFPRLVRSSVSDLAKLKGVSAVQYDLDVAQAGEFSVSWATALNSLVAGA